MDIYERAYLFYVKIRKRAWVIELTEQMRAEADAENRRLAERPRRRKIIHDNLPCEYLQALKERYLALFKDKTSMQQRHVKRMEDILFELAPKASLTPQAEYLVLRTAEGSAWHTQGFGANKYARGTLVWPMARLKAAGFDARIETMPDRILQRDRYGYQYDTYQLVANVTEWQLDAVLRLPDATTGRWVQILEGAGVNPRVYNPFLPYGALGYERA